MADEKTPNRRYPLTARDHAGVVEADRIAEALTLIDADMGAALAPATATAPGRVIIARPGDIAGGRLSAVPVAGDIKNYVEDKIAGLAAALPGMLEALEALSNSLGDDPDFAATIMLRLADKADLSVVKDNLVPVGAEMDFSGTVAPHGWLIENGILIPRADIPALTIFAIEASGNIVTEEEWVNEQLFGAYSYGPGGVNGDYLRIPDTRGLFTRALDLGAGRDPVRMMKIIQASQNLRHKHTGRTALAGAHIHAAWTDAQGSHTHWVSGNREGGAAGAPVTPTYQGDVMILRGGQYTSASGSHAHNVGIGSAPDHDHPFETDESGGDEARPPNVARLKILKY